MNPLAGGCQCGAVRFAAQAAKLDGYWCHCRMCQRAVGSVGAAFINVLKGDLTWVAGAPAHFMSSPFGRRGFCAACGTPLTFDYIDSDKVDLMVGALEDPATAALTSHFGVESRVLGWIPPDDLPEMRSADYAPLAARWRAVGEEPQ